VINTWGVTTGMYHTTKAGILLCFASLPNGVSSGAEILAPYFSYPSYSSCPRGCFVPTIKVIVLVPAGPIPGIFIQSLERFAMKNDTMVGACMDFFQHLLSTDL
jgi:hypothetical protein